MAIALDSALTTYTATGLATSITRAHTCTGSDVLLFAAFETATITTDNVTDVTYDSVSFLSNRVGLAQFTTGGDGNTYLHYETIGTGDETSHNCVITCSTADVFRLYTASYTGVDQTNPIDASNTNVADTVASTEVSTSITVVDSDCWAFMVCANNAAAPDPETNATELTTGTGGGFGCFHSNGTISTGSYSMGWSIGSATGQGTVLCSFSPVVVATTNVKSVAGISNV